jgi:hypothetical protein
MSTKKRSGGNEGIQANSVVGDVIAVGRGAQAVKMVFAETDRKEMLAAVGKIREELEGLKLDRAQLEEVKEHAQELEHEVAQKQPNPQKVGGALETLVGKLKQVGVAVTEVAGLVTPIKTIAGLLHLTMASLGLF